MARLFLCLGGYLRSRTGGLVGGLLGRLGRGFAGVFYRLAGRFGGFLDGDVVVLTMRIPDSPGLLTTV